MKVSLLFLCLYMLCFNSYGQDEDLHVYTEYIDMGYIIYEPKTGYDACGQKYTTQDRYKIQTNSYIIYTGDKSKENVDLKIKTIQTSAPKSKWVRKETSKNHRGSSKNLACKVLIPAVTEEIEILLDSTQSEHYIIMEIEEDILSKKGGREEWIETICGDAVDNKFVSALQNALGLRGYYKKEITETIDIDTKNALIEFQRDNNLRIGVFDLETCRALGVIF